MVGWWLPFLGLILCIALAAGEIIDKKKVEMKPTGTKLKCLCEREK